MENGLKKVILVVVIIGELAALFYVYPKKDISRADYLDILLSKVCLNTGNIFEAYKRSEALESMGMRTGAWIIMYYADFSPRPGKEYLAYFGPVAQEMENSFIPYNLKGYRVYFRKDLTWDRFKKSANLMFNNYGNTDECYAVYRKDFDAEEYFF